MKDLREFHDPNLYLPINGKTYTVQCPNAEQGLRLKAYVLSPESTDMTESGRTNLEMMGMVLNADYDAETDTMSGGLWDELVADGIPLEEIYHVANTAIAHFAVGDMFGEFWWENRLGKEMEPLVPEATVAWMQQAAEQKAEAEQKPERKTRKKVT